MKNAPSTESRPLNRHYDRSQSFKRVIEAQIVSDDAAPCTGQADMSMTTSSTRTIAGAVYGDVPNGFPGVSARLGDDPLSEPQQYELAFDLFSRRE